MNILATLQEILVQDYNVGRVNLEPEAQLSALGIDSLGLLELMFKIEDTFHLKIPGDPPTDLVTVQDICNYIEGLVSNQARLKEEAAGPGVEP